MAKYTKRQIATARRNAVAVVDATRKLLDARVHDESCVMGGHTARVDRNTSAILKWRVFTDEEVCRWFYGE